MFDQWTESPHHWWMHALDWVSVTMETWDFRVTEEICAFSVIKKKTPTCNIIVNREFWMVQGPSDDRDETTSILVLLNGTTDDKYLIWAFLEYAGNWHKTDTRVEKNHEVVKYGSIHLSCLIWKTLTYMPSSGGKVGQFEAWIQKGCLSVRYTLLSTSPTAHPLGNSPELNTAVSLITDLFILSINKLKKLSPCVNHLVPTVTSSNVSLIPE